MADSKIWTADELLAMTPDERDHVIRAGIIDDPTEIPAAVINVHSEGATRDS